MTVTILLPVLTALSALLGVALTAYVQLRNQRNGHQFQLAIDAAKHERERAEKEKTATLERIAAVHKSLSRVAREFSITNLDILWRADMTDGEYDLRYLAACAEMDDLRVFASLHQPVLTDEVESLHGQMNIFWGNFKNVLHRNSLGKTVDHTSSCLLNSHAAAREIATRVAAVKRRLSDLAASVRTND